MQQAGQRYSREQLESDEAFAAAAQAPPSEETYADVYGCIVNAVIDTLDDNEAERVAHEADLRGLPR